MKCIDYFFGLLSRRDYTEYELTKKAQDKGFSNSDITEAISDLQQKDYQSDTRFVINMITSAQGKYGKSVVKRKCQEKGIKSDLFEEIWLQQTEEEIHEDLSSLKAKVMRKYKISDFYSIDPKTKGKLINYLKYRGFNAFEILHQWQEEMGNGE